MRRVRNPKRLVNSVSRDPDDAIARIDDKRHRVAAAAVDLSVDEEVLKNSKLVANMSDRVTSEELRKWLEGLNDEDLGRYKM